MPADDWNEVIMGHAEYNIVSVTRRRSFAITASLSERFGQRGITHDYREASDVIREWTAVQGGGGQGYLPGAVQTGTYVLGHGSGKRTSTDLEPAIVFSGNVSSYLDNTPDATIKKMLNELAYRLAVRLGQDRIEVEYCDEAWAIQPKPRRRKRSSR
jgi:hypothetical protein